MNKDLKPYTLMVDNLSAKQMGWMNAYGEKIALPISGQESWKCKKTDLFISLKIKY